MCSHPNEAGDGTQYAHGHATVAVVTTTPCVDAEV